MNGSSLGKRYRFPYHALRNISAPEDVDNNRRIYAGTAPAQSFLKLPEDENVRTYIVTAEGKKSRRLTDVHRRIRETLKEAPTEFVVLNGGITIVAKDIEVDDKTKTAVLVEPSIINGSQTRGELCHYFDTLKTDAQDISCKFELVITSDDALVAEVSIARNFQNDVATLSIAGRRGVLDDLEKALQKTDSELKLRKSETDRAESYHDTEKLIQVLMALVPPELWPKANETDDPRKVYTYSMKAKCLNEYQKTYNEKDSNPQAAELYEFFIDMAAEAKKIYETWKAHPGFRGTGIRAIDHENGQIVDVPDGIIFPIIAALSNFVRKKNGKWQIIKPSLFRDEELIQAAKSQYMNSAHSNPWNMGKNQSIYSSLFQITGIYRRLDDAKK